MALVFSLSTKCRLYRGHASGLLEAACRMWIGLNQLMTQTSGGLWLAWQGMFREHKRKAFLDRLTNSTVGSRGHAVAQLVRHCATSRKVAGSIPDDVIGIFH